eukprot:SAG11_NODE_14_length_26344_cov_14.209411_6_plen_61_part_00
MILVKIYLQVQLHVNLALVPVVHTRILKFHSRILQMIAAFFFFKKKVVGSVRPWFFAPAF